MSLKFLIKYSLLPLGFVIWSLLLGLVLQNIGVVWFAGICLYFCSIFPVANALLKKLEFYPPINLKKNYSDVCYIVVIGAAKPQNSPEYLCQQPTAMTIERARYAGFLHKMTGLPLLTSGGGRKSEADVMADYLAMDYSIKVAVREGESLTTWQNGLFCMRMLKAIKPVKIILVTHAWHMPRAVLSFTQAGFEVIPAPTAYANNNISLGRWKSWLPQAKNLYLSELALHEYLGILAYRIRFLIKI